VTTGTPDRTSDLIEIAGGIVSAYVSRNPVPAAELPKLIHSVHTAIAGLASGGISDAPASTYEIQKPSALQIRKSVRDDGITSFIDGRTYKTLKRHLSAKGLDPHSYRERFGLPSDYPMVAPSYAEKRSALARAIGLGVPGARRSA
jgi:predicted transcriptional regulator